MKARTRRTDPLFLSLVAATTFATAIVGCSGTPAAQPEAATPRGALINVAVAAESADTALFFASVWLEPGQEKLGEAWFEFAVESNRLYREAVKAYGQQAVDKERWLPVEGLSVRRFVERAPVAITGDRAVAKLLMIDDRHQYPSLVKVAGAWKLAPNIPPGFDPAPAIRDYNLMTSRMVEVRKKIGRVPLETIKSELEKAPE
ncbi:MAG: hypothetical protein ACYSTY_12395 [Planctomycetota bacterium]|jgi:hypothetical protein